jgi:hypothetical protein
MAAVRELTENLRSVVPWLWTASVMFRSKGMVAGSQALMKRRDILPVGWMAWLSVMINPPPPRALLVIGHMGVGRLALKRAERRKWGWKTKRLRSSTPRIRNGLKSSGYRSVWAAAEVV